MTTANNLRDERLKKLEKIKEIGWNPYPASFNKTHSCHEALNQKGKVVKTAGKLFSFRTHGNIAFADLKDETGRIQIFFKKDTLGDTAYKHLNLLDIGDYIGVEGDVMTTVAGEISILPKTYTLLSKSLLPLPHEWYGLKDVESRYRQRYLDLLLNPEVRNRFNVRTKVIKAVRKYLDDLGFWEVETPVLQSLYGGANAKPFTTHLNALNIDMYLRIALELYLKRLVIGGYERVYEIGKNFRNEGVDRSHNPEFSMIEWYEAYANYHRVMDVAEGLFKFVAENVTGSPKIKVGDKEINISTKWPRIEMTQILKNKLNIDVQKLSLEDLIAYAKQEKIELVGGETKGQLIFVIFEHKIPPLLIEPTWIIDYPEDVSPLAKNHESKPGWVERFEGYIGGREICDGWSELTDPQVQRQRLKADSGIARRDKDEAQQVDEDFITAMEYGMPPLGGIGIGIERLIMFFTNNWIIKEVILFPTLRPEGVYVNHTISDTNKTQNSTKLLAREKALLILNKYIKNKNLIKHCLAVEAVMRGLASHFKTDVYMWGLLGLIHDADWEATAKDYSQHARVTVDWLKDAGETNEELVSATLSHNYIHNKSDAPQKLMDWALYCSDDLTGLIVATALVMPDKKLASVSVESVLKKFNTKSFAANVNREQIKLCEEKLGIPLSEFVGLVLKSMQTIASELGL